MNLMWRLETKTGVYAIKQLSKDIDLSNRAVRNYYELTETIAYHFSKQGIPAISAMGKRGHHLFEVGGIYFLVYPWVYAKAISKELISEQERLKIANMMAKMHLINIDIPNLSNPGLDNCSTERLLELIDRAKTYHCTFSKDLLVNKSSLVAMNNASQIALEVLNETLVVSHGDMDPKNVLWDSLDNPVLIDWECARKVNP
ncbi:MAG: phosphotransferase, partial [Myxococcaceae bacterium]